ncbi:MAG: cytochrome c family protein [Pseudomonadota bacterium]
MIFPKPSIAIICASFFVVGCGGDTPTDTDSPPASSPSAATPSAAAPVEAPDAEVSEAFAALPEPYASADFNRGRRTFKLCQSCHTLNEGGQNLVGPNLYGVFGREIGGVDGYTYSKAVQESDIVWTPEILAEWLESPRDFLPGNKMSFAGVRRPEDRIAVIAYIMAETGYSNE